MSLNFAKTQLIVLQVTHHTKLSKIIGTPHQFNNLQYSEDSVSRSHRLYDAAKEMRIVGLKNRNNNDKL